MIIRNTQGLDDISKRSIIQHAIDKTTHTKIRDYQNLKQEVRDFTELQKKIEEDQKTK